MQTLGEELKRRREERQITLTDISEATRIGTRFLKAIETDSYSVLPGGIFTRSFIRAYAKQVGMDEDEAIALYQQQVTGVTAEAAPQPRIESRPPTLVEPPRPASPARPRRAEPLTYTQSGPSLNWTTIVIGGGIAIFIIIIVLALVRQLNRSSQESAQTPRNAAGQTNANQSSGAPPTPVPTAQTNTASQPESSQTAASSPGVAPNVTQGESLAVKIEALEGSWVQYKVDDGKAVSKIMKKGQIEEVPPASSQVKIDYGTSKTLKLMVNNREVVFPPNAPDRDGHVLISRDGIQPVK